MVLTTIWRKASVFLNPGFMLSEAIAAQIIVDIVLINQK